MPNVIQDTPFTIHPHTGIGLVKLRVSDLKRSIAFYREAVGLQVLKEGSGSAELTADGERPLVLLEEIPDAVKLPRRSAAGLYHYALLVPTREALGLALRNLIRTGIHIGQADHLVSEALYIADPDNNGIEIYADRPRPAWSWDERGEVRMAVDPIDWDGLLDLAEGKEWTGLPEGTIIGHIHLHVSDLARSRSFYNGVMGFDVTAHMDDSALFLSAGGYHHHIGLNVWAGVGAALAPQAAAGLSYYTIELPEPEALEKVIGRLEAAGLPFKREGTAVIVQDPSGITLHLVLRAV
ncbi:VOC family protein [Paenibacillus filicis]|uniref:VOC family protein n=1 Tax=Paenibacillus gyeongsangnamensis TaxID=3388067 RepID=A0ABT4Q735_9BACL|nr:VOC family protein [Paenibacillus filicis]MCZ8512679.1 VOC family protein [Paenibacillus filicis]